MIGPSYNQYPSRSRNLPWQNDPFSLHLELRRGRYIRTSSLQHHHQAPRFNLWNSANHHRPTENRLDDPLPMERWSLFSQYQRRWGRFATMLSYAERRFQLLFLPVRERKPGMLFGTLSNRRLTGQPSPRIFLVAMDKQSSAANKANETRVDMKSSTCSWLGDSRTSLFSKGNIWGATH